MRNGQLSLSATDLANHLGCAHLTELDLRAARREISPPVWKDPTLEVLQARGFEHEAAYLEHLRASGLSVIEVVAADGKSASEATLAAMRTGADVISQPTLTMGRWFGRADVLRKVQATSELGPWSYEVTDTKLARSTRAGTILQLCLYSEAIGEMQGRLPERMHVVSPGGNFEPETFRLLDYLAYYRLVKTRLENRVDAASKRTSTYPEPVPQCDICRWWSMCDRRRHEDDHLSLVAGISRLHRRELSSVGITTLASLAQVPLPLEHRPSRGAVDSYVRIREQARVQLEGRERDEPVYELLERAPGGGLARLPAPSPGDVFFDIEGDAFAGTGGLEYLFGWVGVADGSPSYHAQWALDGQQEREMFEAFVDEVMVRWQAHPDLHVYHYSGYEPGAMKRLMGRYATREDEVDRMLRAGLFVDLYSITKQSVRASVERYSIKDLERFYGFERQVELRDASKNLRAFERALELGQVDVVPDDVRDVVQRYNRDDCVSTLHLRDWLEGLRRGLEGAGEVLARPEPGDGAPSQVVDERQQRVDALRERVLEGVPADRAERTPEEQARWLLAYMLDWHRREGKAPWWEYFRLAALDDEELIDEQAGVAGLKFVDTVGGTARYPVHRYRFPPQDLDLEEDDALFQVGGDPLGSVVAVDTQARILDIKKRGDTAELHPGSAFEHTVMATNEQSEALFRLGEWVATNGVAADGPHRAERDLLLGLGPRCRGRAPDESTPLQAEDGPGLDAARRLVMDLDGGVLAVQGPPGAGKTYTGARMICEAVRAGLKVGITATSHKVIRNLLDEVIDAASEEELPISCLHKITGKAARYEGGPFRETGKNADVDVALDDGSVQVVGGTAWLWSRQACHRSLDVLFVDEAGQMSLANVLAVAQAAHSLVLLGDPQQLEQPLKGSHPEGTEVSALEHLLDGKKTIPAHKGLFLSKTWRLHPSICALTSELFYEGRLLPREDLGQQAVIGETDLEGAGLWLLPVEHEGNRNSSLEEVERVAELYEHLVSGNLAWRDRHGVEAPITDAEVLIVAPYNAQVGLLGERIPNARIGTVDKFQGQEAPIVIYSMATSSPEEAPRGMEFLYSLNRLNVATSRARCVCVLVASPRLFEPHCRTPRQMQLANAFCRYAELATTLG